MRYFDATKYFSVKMTQQAKILIIPSFLSIKGEELSAIFCNVVTIKAKVPTHHEQAPSYDEKKVISAFYIHGTGIVSDYVHMYMCVQAFINTSLPSLRIIYPLQKTLNNVKNARIVNYIASV